MIAFTKHGGLELVAFAIQTNLTFIINLIKRKHDGNSWYLIFAVPIILSRVMVYF